MQTYFSGIIEDVLARRAKGSVSHDEIRAMLEEVIHRAVAEPDIEKELKKIKAVLDAIDLTVEMAALQHSRDHGVPHHGAAPCNPPCAIFKFIGAYDVLRGR